MADPITYPPLVDNPDIHVGPYSIPVSSPLSIDRNQLVMISKFANGDEQRRLLLDRSRSTIVASHQKIKLNWYNKIYQFYIDRKGPFEAFNVWFRWSYDTASFKWNPWLAPAPYKYRFSEDGFKVVSNKEKWFDVEIKLIETNELGDQPYFPTSGGKI